MRNQHILMGLLAWTLCAGAQAADSVAARLAAQIAFFVVFFVSVLKAHPERATAFGDYRYNDQLDDISLAAVNAQHERDQSFLKRLNAISTTGFPEQDALSHQVMARMLEQRNADYDFKDYEMPVNQMSGPHTLLAV